MGKIVDVGYKVLNEMLGGGLQSGVTLIRGAPGSGKTTLCMNIIDHYLKTDKNHHVILFSLEMDPNHVLNHAADKYDLSMLRDAARILPLNRRMLEDDILSISMETDPKNLVKAAGETLSRFDPEKLMTSSAKVMLGLTAFIRKQLNPKTILDPAANVGARLVVIDSLNVLVDIIMHSMPEADVRQVLNVLCREVHAKFEEIRRNGVEMGELTILFTGEYHNNPSEKVRLASESFFCDTEILLQPEPICMEGGSELEGKISLGYYIGSPKRADAQAIEVRSFCRVLKSRFSQSQSRRCLYDIVPGKGVVFYESYPGDGHIQIFAENSPQKSEWQEFNRNVLPLSYPTLRSETFDKNNLQRVFAGLRHLRNVPSRTDLYFSSFDSYWITWYNELWERWEIRDQISRLQKESNRTGRELFKKVPQIHALVHELAELQSPPDRITVEAAASEWDLAPLSQPEAAGLVGRCLDKISIGSGAGTFFSPIPFSELKLFGEQRSRIISQLSPEPGNEPSKLLSVPYDANVSMYIFEKNRIRDFLENDAQKAKYKEEIRQFIDTERFALRLFLEHPNFQNERVETREIDKFVANGLPSEDVSELAFQRINGLLDHGPGSWEEMIALAKVLKMNIGIETQTFDTFLCAFLEMVWNCQGELRTNACYEIQDKARNLPRIFLSVFLLYHMFREEIIPKNCTLELPQEPDGVENRSFLFSRHWYSTFVNHLTARNDRGDFKWRPGQGSFDLMRIPVSLLLNPGGPEGASAEVKHHSCWGEWHFAILNGSENLSLGIELINHFMSSQKVRDRAFSGAALPSVQDFYSIYGDTRCFNFADRRDIVLPNISFDGIAKTFFTDAKSRNDIFDYRHTMREFHALLSNINSFANTFDVRKLIDRFFHTINNVEKLKDAELLAT